MAGASIDDIATALKLGNQNLSAQMQALIAALSEIFPQVSSIAVGTFTLGATATTTVTQSRTAANSLIVFTPTNAAGATLMGSAKSLYISARTANTSFAVSTASAAAAAGTETFVYLLINT